MEVLAEPATRADENKQNTMLFLREKKTSVSAVMNKEQNMFPSINSMLTPKLKLGAI